MTVSATRTAVPAVEAAVPNARAARTDAPRVGILTLHYGCNYGAMLQALATAKLFGGVVVDCRYRPKARKYAGAFRHQPHLLEFLENELPLTDEQFLIEHGDHRPVWRHIERNFDLLVCGSDELWKLDYGGRPSLRQTLAGLLRHPIRTVWHSELRQDNAYSTPFPNLYWPDASTPTVGFAGSVGEVDTAQIPRRHRRLMADRLRGFALVGVRDRKTAEFFGELLDGSGPPVVTVPDPVFTYEPPQRVRVTESAAAKIAAAGADPHAPFIARHLMRPQRSAERAERACVGVDLPVVDLPKLPLTPPEWFAALGLARGAVVDAMHPLISCLCHDVPCLSLDWRTKSAELRHAFGIDDHETLHDALERWPTDVGDRVAERRKLVRDFVGRALAAARRPSGGDDHP